MLQMVDAWGGWSLFQVLLQTMKKIASKHGVSIPTVALKYILDQVNFVLDMHSNIILSVTLFWLNRNVSNFGG